jgi:hypothetical protein
MVITQKSKSLELIMNLKEKKLKFAKKSNSIIECTHDTILIKDLLEGKISEKNKSILAKQLDNCDICRKKLIELSQPLSVGTNSVLFEEEIEVDFYDESNISQEVKSFNTSDLDDKKDIVKYSIITKSTSRHLYENFRVKTNKSVLHEIIEIEDQVTSEVYERLKKSFQSNHIDAFILDLPFALSFKFAEFAMHYGKHILMTVPDVFDETICESLIDVIKKYPKVTCGFIMQHKVFNFYGLVNKICNSDSFFNLEKFNWDVSIQNEFDMLLPKFHVQQDNAILLNNLTEKYFPYMLILVAMFGLPYKIFAKGIFLKDGIQDLIVTLEFRGSGLGVFSASDRTLNKKLDVRNSENMKQISHYTSVLETSSPVELEKDRINIIYDTGRILLENNNISILKPSELKSLIDSLSIKGGDFWTMKFKNNTSQSYSVFDLFFDSILSGDSLYCSVENVIDARKLIQNLWLSLSSKDEIILY